MARTLEVSPPEMAMIVATRVVLGLGIGLLVAGRMDPRTRRGAGWTMLLGGIVSTIPLGIEVLSRRVRRDAALSSEPISRSAPPSHSPW